MCDRKYNAGALDWISAGFRAHIEYISGGYKVYVSLPHSFTEKPFSGLAIKL